MLLFSLYRVFSRDIPRRQAELTWFLDKTRRIFRRLRPAARSAAGQLDLWRRQWKDRHTHYYLRCPSCRHRLRLPRGKGLLTVTCPVCKKTFRRKT